MQKPEEMAEKVKSEILADMWAGRVPYSVKSFSELHDYVDANCYGGSEALLDELDAAAVDNDEGHKAALDQICDLMNSVFEIIDEWLAGQTSHPESCDRNINVRLSENVHSHPEPH